MSGHETKTQACACNAARAALAVALCAFTGCALREPADFGKGCVNDGECRGQLVCDAEEQRCLPPKPPPDPAGLTCKDPLTLAMRQTQGLFAGSIRVPAAEGLSPTAGGVACGNDVDHWLYIAVDVPVPMSARLRARATNKVSLAILGRVCSGGFEHACSVGSSEAELVLPFLDEGPIVIAVAGVPGDELQLELAQVNCPAGFLPVEGEERCRGFVPVGGPAPRRGHQISLLEDGTPIVTGGDDGTGGFLDAEAFNVDLRTWSDIEQAATRTGHAAIARHEHLFVAGGSASVFGEYLEPGARAFGADFALEEARGVVGGTLTRLTEEQPFLFVGGALPAVAVFADVTGNCTGSPCAPGFTCLAEAPKEFDVFGPVGHCVCLREDCNRLIFDTPFWIADDSAPPAVRFRTRHLALDIDPADDVAEILIFGGATENGLAQPMLFIARSRTWIDLGISGEELQRRSDPLGARVGSNVLIVGGRDAEEQPLDLVEIWAPRVGVILASKRLARPRADAVAVLAQNGEELLVIGGDDGVGPLASSEIVDTVSGATRAGPRLPIPLQDARAVAMGDDALIVGGFSSDGLVQDAFLLTTIGAGLAVPEFGAGPDVPELHFGDTCDDAIPIEVPLDAPRSGTIAGNTLNLRDDLDIALTDPSCTGFQGSAGVDIFFAIEVPAGGSLDATFANPDAQVDTVLLAYDSCPVSPPCRAGADSESFQGAEAIHIDNTGGAAETILLVGDTYLDLGPYSYVLDWTITP